MSKIESIKEKLRKLLALVEGASTESERENARIKVSNILFKYKLTIEEVMDNQEREYKIRYKTPFDKKLIIQVYCLVKEMDSMVNTSRRGEKAFHVMMTKTEKADFDVYYDYYRELFKTELNLFWIAFLSKYEITNRNSKRESEPSTLSKKERLRLMELMGVFKDDTLPVKRLQA